jgi:hypothetical protein
MILDVRPFEQVFDGTANFVARAIVDRGREDLPIVNHLLSDFAVEGEDGLHSFRAVPLALLSDGEGERRFALWVHAGNPDGHVELRLPMDGEYTEYTLSSILLALGVPFHAVIWWDHDTGPPVEAAPVDVSQSMIDLA